MHSIIVQVSTKPIDKQDYLDVSRVIDMPNGFIDGIADYVADFEDDEVLEATNWFLKYGKDRNYWNVHEEDGRRFFVISDEQRKHFLESYLENIFNHCREVLANQDGIKEKFMRRGFNDYLFELENSLKDDFQIRIIDEWDINMDLVSWLKSMNADVNTRYYIGNVLDWHF